MSTVMTAGFIHYSEDEDVLMVGFADREQEAERYVLLQRSKLVLEDEERLGFDQVHISVDQQERSAYGGITGVALHSDKVVLQIAPETAQLIGVESELVIRLSPDRINREELRSALRLVFGKWWEGVLQHTD